MPFYVSVSLIRISDYEIAWSGRVSLNAALVAAVLMNYGWLISTSSPESNFWVRHQENRLPLITGLYLRARCCRNSILPPYQPLTAVCALQLAIWVMPARVVHGEGWRRWRQCPPPSGVLHRGVGWVAASYHIDDRLRRIRNWWLC